MQRYRYADSILSSALQRASEVTPPAVRCLGLRRIFGATTALAGLDLEINSGTIHALVGENGAGKSTCLGLLAGRISPSAGRVELFGEPVVLRDPRTARRHGVVAIYQELQIVPALSSQANVFLAQPMSRWGVLREDAMRQRFRELSSRLGSIPSDVRARSLSVADQQLIEISRGLLSEARVMLFDEPTASLEPRERDALFKVIRELRDGGVAVVFVSHNLEEVLEVSDVITVFRDGHEIETARTVDWTKQRIVERMLGSKAEALLGAALTDADSHPARRVSSTAKAPEFLRVEDLTVPGLVSDVNLSLAEGEILGLGGLVGSGRTTVLRALAGLEPTARGRLWFREQEVRWPRSPREAIRLGIALIPEDRKQLGLIMQLVGSENVVISDMSKCTTAGVVSGSSILRMARTAAQGSGITPDGLTKRVSALSGGNQQKLLFARWRHRRPVVLLADEPTRGVDVGAKAEILRSLRSLVSDGLAVIMASSELEEVVSVSDQVVVLSEGRPVASLRDDSISVEEILSQAFTVASP